MLTLDNFESAVNSTIVERGQDFSSQAVELLEENPPGTWTASVEGTTNNASNRKIYEHLAVMTKKEKRTSPPKNNPQKPNTTLPAKSPARMR